MKTIDLIHNFTLLIALTVLSGYLIQNKRQTKNLESIIQGVIFGLVAIIGMLSPISFIEGVFFDGRSVVLSLCALFFGPVAAGISTGMALVLRSAQGGNGLLMGDSVIIASAVTGLFFHYKIFKIRNKVEVKHLIALGFIVHGIMVLLMFALPKEIVMLAITKVAVAVMIVYPIATVIIGKIISDYFSRNSYINDLKESEEKFRNLAENTTIAIAIYQNNKWVYANPVSTEMTGFTNNELMKMNFWDFVHPDDRDKVIRLGKARQLSEKTEKSYEFKILTKNNVTKTVWLTGSSTTFNGKPAGLITVMDVTERKLAEDKLKTSEEKFRAIFNSITDGVATRRISRDGIGEFVDINKAYCEMLEYSQEELRNTDPAKYLDPEIMKSMSYIIDELYKNKQIGLKGKHRTRSGRILPVEINCSLFSLNSEEYYVCTSRDISERAEAENILKEVNKELGKLTDKLEQSNKDLESFAYIVSHDLQEPLRMVSSFTQLLETKHSELLNDEAKQYIKFAVDGVNKMKLLITGLLNFSRITTQGNEFKSMNVKETLESVVALFKDKLTANNGAIEFKDMPKDITGDEVQIRQLFQNLIGNSLKFIKEGVTPKIEISAEESENEWIFRVKDNGIGIEDKHKERIFDMFRRLHGSEKFEGTGIGLAFCKQIVKRHGGSIRVESETGKGSTFIFTINKEN